VKTPVTAPFDVPVCSNGSEQGIAIEDMATKDKAGAVSRRPRLNALPAGDEESGSKGIHGLAHRADRALPMIS